MTTNKQILYQGLWSNNPALMQLLGLCPLLAVSNTAISALTLGIATIIVLVASNIIISSIKSYISFNLRIPYFMVIIASMVTLIVFLLQAYSYDLYKSLGVYLALITTNCVILGRIEAFAYKNSVLKSALDGLANGLGFTVVLLLLGSLREIIGQGTLFANSQLLFGAAANNFVIHFGTANNFILALLPPGAFFIMGLLIASKNILTSKVTKKNIVTYHEQSTKITDIPKIPRAKS